MECGIVFLVLTSTRALQAFAQVNERAIVTKDDPRSPVKIMNVRTKGIKVESNKPFVDDDN